MGKNKILISILIPTYNRRKYLEECLNSIVEQQGFNLKKLELIVSDNSEGHETNDFMNDFIKNHKNWNIKYNKNIKNLGMVGNWNKLLDLKKGEYFIFLSDDDKFYDKNSLKKLYDGLKEYNLDACYGKYMAINGKSEYLGLRTAHKKVINKKIYIDKFNEQIKWHTISFGGILYKDFGYRYQLKFNMAADWNWNLRLLYNQKKIGIINCYTFCYRWYPTNSSKTAKFKTKMLWRYNNYQDFNVKYKVAKMIYFGILELFSNITNSYIGSKIISFLKKICKKKNYLTQ